MHEKVPGNKAYPVLCFLVPVQDKTTGSHHFHYKFENRHTHPDTHNLLPVALIHRPVSDLLHFLPPAYLHKEAASSWNRFHTPVH